MSYFIYQSKRIYYSETGKGKPVVFLHGNTASSRMFEPLLPLYKEDFTVILMDFLGNGRSDRLDGFPADLWQEEARQTIALLEHLNYGRVSLAGCSGGAWAAVNAGLLRPDLVEKVVADSFDGRTLGEDFVRKLIRERAGAKQDEQAAGFYQWCQGEDWERIVDMDTKALVQCAQEGRPLFLKPLSELKVPLLLMGSAGDEMVRPDLLDEYEAISRETEAEICMFPEGGHPAVFSNAEQAAEVIRKFLLIGLIRHHH
ncbi:MAG TPA: alpha/beta hydrolase [Candidatus Blautia gallistercoris]|uniref:Alpha/beta hydrolase n=1 Tax=Candidatus Blautia gallistercoris TaxID=2838490 RepID=A0A9D2B2Y0_9FIRM|nr:alpha/beta hydrolase [Candidatus Blautia gallistercoris]